MAARMRQHLPHAFADDPAEAWEQDLFAVFNGGLDIARVGRIPRHLAKAIGSSTTIVNVVTAVAQKIRGKHSDVTFPELRELATVFSEGDGSEVARDSRTSLVFWYESPERSGRMLNAVVNCTNHGSELWLKSVYPIPKKRLKRLRAKAMIVRDKR